jgi:hypothetical protein
MRANSWNKFCVLGCSYRASEIAAIADVEAVACCNPITGLYSVYIDGFDEPGSPEDFILLTGIEYQLWSDYDHAFSFGESATYKHYLDSQRYTLFSASDIQITGGITARLTNPHLQSRTFSQLLNPTTLTNGVTVQEIQIFDDYGNTIETLNFVQASSRTLARYQAFGIKLSGSSTWNAAKETRDFDAPIASITSPKSYSVVSGITTIQASAIDSSGIVTQVGTWQVAFYVDSLYLGSDYSYPYSCSWNTFQQSNAKHTLKIVAFDKMGNAVTVSICVYVSNDNPPPPPR